MRNNAQQKAWPSDGQAGAAQQACGTSEAASCGKSRGKAPSKPLDHGVELVWAREGSWRYKPTFSRMLEQLRLLVHWSAAVSGKGLLTMVLSTGIGDPFAEGWVPRNLAPIKFPLESLQVRQPCPARGAAWAAHYRTRRAPTYFPLKHHAKRRLAFNCGSHKVTFNLA